MGVLKLIYRNLKRSGVQYFSLCWK
jgi:hypothetical protein